MHRFPTGGSRPTRGPQRALWGVASHILKSVEQVSIKENDHITLANFIHDPLADHKMETFVICPPQKRPSPTDSPTAADSNDPGILDPGEGAPTNSGRNASNTGNTKCRKYQDSYLNYGFISFSR